MPFGLVSNLTEDIQALPFGALPINAITSAGYTLVLTDAGKLVTVSNASAQNLTIPLNSSVAYATGTVIEVLNIGAGTWTLTATGGVTLTGTTSVPTSARVRLTKTGTDTWYAHASGGGGLTLVASSTFSASSAVSLNSCFTSAYENYRIVVYGTGTGLDNRMRLRVASVDNTTATSYLMQRLIGVGTTPTAIASSQNYWTTGNFQANRSSAVIDIFGPALAQTTGIISLSTGSDQATYLESGYHTAASAFDGFTYYPSSTTISGTLRVYGYQNA